MQEEMQMKLNEKRIIEYLRNHVDEEISSYLLVQEAGASEKDLRELERNELFDMNDQVHRIARDNGFRLDMRKHADRLEGLPFVLDFKIRKTDESKQ